MSKTRTAPPPAATVPCPCCEGGGVQRLTVETRGEPGEKAYDITCVFCKGSKVVTPAESDAWQEMMTAWCDCPTPGDSKFYADGEHADLHKHHYRCVDCGGITQIG